MARREGFYGIIQFCPNPERLEGVNVGVYLFCQPLNALRVRVSTNNDRVRARFGAQAFDDRRLTADKDALKRRMEELGHGSNHDVARFVAQEAGRLVLTHPRPIAVTNLDEDVDELFAELVADKPKTRKQRARAPNIKDVLEPIAASVPLQRDLTVEIPALKQKLHVPYGYLNEAMNYIKPHGFSTSEQAALSSASHLGVQGLMLHNHPFVTGDGETVKQKLVVVADFESGKDTTRVRERVVELLREFPVRVVPMSDVQSLVRDIQAHARPVARD